MTYYDQTFEPFKIVDGKCVVADESEWEKLGSLDDQSTFRDEGEPRPIVKVPDIFKDVEGAVVDNQGRSIHESYDRRFHWTTIQKVDGRLRKPMQIVDIFTRFFQTIDSTPHVDYLIVTQYPELLRDKWQYESETVTKQFIGRPEKHVIEVKRRCTVMPNVILATYVETQSDIERLVPELLKCHDLCKGLAVVCNPKEELNFATVDDGKTRPDEDSLRYTAFGSCIGLVIAEGNEHPIHPQWLRSLRDQCKDADVKFNFASWGDYVPVGQTVKKLPVGDYQMKTVNDDYYVRVGKENAGRLLDGQEHNGRIQ